MRAKQADEEGGLDVAALEAEAAAAGSAADRGSRKASSGKQAKAVADRTAEEAKRQSRFAAKPSACRSLAFIWPPHLLCGQVNA